LSSCANFFLLSFLLHLCCRGFMRSNVSKVVPCVTELNVTTEHNANASLSLVSFCQLKL